MQHLSIIIINWNTGNLIEKCLTSIYKSKTKYKFKVYVVDNNSIDNSVKIIKKFKKVKLIQNKKNLGMANSSNQIIKQTDSEFILFLHPDTEISPNTIENMLNFMNKYPQITIAGPRLVYPNNKIFFSCHKFPTLINLVKDKIGLNGVYMRKANHNNIQKVDIIASACLFYRRQPDYLFDERFTNWCAEWDLAYRLKNHKSTQQNKDHKEHKIVYAPITKVIHYEVMSDTNLEYKKHSFLIADIMLQRLLLFYKKHYSWFKLIQLKKFITFTLLIQSIAYPFRARHYWKAIKTTIKY